MPRRRSLFSIDPGWPWVAAGLLFIAAAVVVPAQRLLEQDRAELRRLQGVEARIYRLLEAHDRFLSDLREGEESLLLRLAASNLNRMPQDRAALVISDSIDRHPIEWIDAAVPAADAGSPPRPASLLERVLAGKGRLWVTAVGVLCLFTGLLLGPGWSPRRREAAAEGEPARTGAVGGLLAAAAGESSRSGDERDRWRPSPAAWRRARRLEAEVPVELTPIAGAAADASSRGSTKADEEVHAPPAGEGALQEAPTVQDDATLWSGEPSGDLEESPEIAALAAAADREPDRPSEQRPIRVSAAELAMLLAPPDASEPAKDLAVAADASIRSAVGERIIEGVEVSDGQGGSDLEAPAAQERVAGDAEPTRTLHGSGAPA